MTDFSEKIIKYRNFIPHNEVQDAFIVYYETKDFKIRENLIYRYMPIVKNKVLNFGITSIEEEDLIQMGYEFLIKCIDIYNPYNKSSFSSYLSARIDEIVKISKENNLSLTKLNILANDNLENRVINKEFENYLINEIKKYLDKNSNQKGVELFKLLFGIDCEKHSDSEIMNKFGIKHSYIHILKKRYLIYLYLYLQEKCFYYPSEMIENIRINDPTGYVKNISREKMLELQSLDFSKMDHIVFYDSCDSIYDSHTMVERNNR